jgi:flagellar biosynthesis protein FlhA
MRLLLGGGSRPEIMAAVRLAAASGAAVRHLATLDAALEQLRSGHGADLLLLDAGTDISAAMARLMAERIFLPVVAYGVDCPPQTAAAAIRSGAREFLPLPPEAEAGRGEIRAGMLLVMDPQGRPITLPGEGTTEPTFGLAATWVVPGLRDEAMLMGLTVVDPATVITTHLTELVRDNLADLLTYAETQKLLGDLPAQYQKLMGELVPARITTAGIQRVLQGLLGERVSIRDLPRILEAIAEALAVTQSTMLITEHVRARLARQITTVCTGESGLVPIITLSPAWEQAFAAALTGHGDERQLAMAPSELQRFVREVQESLETYAMRGELPALVTMSSLRPFVRSVIERFRPATVVLSQNELHPKARLRTLGQI